MKMSQRQALERFVQPEGDCLVWTGRRDRQGYGLCLVVGERRYRVAHVIAWEISVGPVPVGLELDHLCRNTSCVKVGHLEPVSHAENVRRDRLARFGYDPALTCPAGHPRIPGRACKPCNLQAVRRYNDRKRALP